MRTSIVTAMLMALLCCMMWADEAPRLIDNMQDPSLYTPAQPELGHKWTGEVSLEQGEAQQGKGCLRFDIHSARSGEESYPQWGRSLRPQDNDWSGYRALRYWVKVVSEDPAVREKAMCVVVYNGDSPLQQFVQHKVPVGRWVQLTDSIIGYNRDRVRGIVIYMYETDPSRQDDYSWWVDGIEIIPVREGEVGFDTGTGRPVSREPKGPLHALTAPGGPSLVFDDAGRIAGVSVHGQQLREAQQPVTSMSGFMVRDHKTDKFPRPVQGTLKRSGETLTQQQAFDDGLRVSATIRPDGDRIRFGVDVRDTTDADRPLTLYFAVPIDALGWTWWDDIRTRREIAGEGDFWHHEWYPITPRWSSYPFCCISNETVAVCLGVPLSLPRVQRMVYDPRNKLLYIAYDFCLTPAAVKQKQTARFEFDLFCAEPKWGFRSAVQKYYNYFPAAFDKRIPRDGGWGCWGTYEGNPNIPDLGFLYHWGPDPRGGKGMAGSVRFDNENGYLSLPYIEWTNLHVSMEGYETADNEQIMERIRWIADAKRTEPLSGLSYLFPYDARLGPDREGWMREAFQAYLKSLIYTKEGLLYGGADKSEFSALIAKYIPINPDPDIPGGAGEFFLKRWWPTIEKYYAEEGVRIDGFGWDNFYVKGQSFDYRREHFAAADEPLMFDPDSLEPVILKDMATFELQREVVKKLRAMGRYLIANQGRVSMVGATLPLLDVFGYEWNINSTGTYARTLAQHKPVCTLPCAPDHYKEPFVREHLLYGIWPGGYYSTTNPDYVALMRRYVPIIRRQSKAGWEPITLAVPTRPEVQVERFGSGNGDDLLFSLKNTGQEDAPVEVRINPCLLLPGVSYEARELVGGEALGKLKQAPQPSFTLPAPPGEVVVVAVEALE